MSKFKIKSDKYSRVRGGNSKFLNILCENCKQLILLYQKDGPGLLKRLYFDRIFSPPELVNLHKLSIGQVSNLTCLNCKKTLGVPYVYAKEKRLSFRLFVGAVIKRIK